MKTRSFHINNLGRFGSGLVHDSQGFVTVHDHDRYKKATEEQLNKWASSKLGAVKNAASSELIERRIQAWRDSSIAK